MGPTAGAVAGSQAGVLAAIGQAIKASGSIIQMDKENFEKILDKTDQKLILVSSAKGFFGKNQYLIPYKGFTFYLKHRDHLRIPEGFEVITAKKIWSPY